MNSSSLPQTQRCFESHPELRPRYETEVGGHQARGPSGPRGRRARKYHIPSLVRGPVTEEDQSVKIVTPPRIMFEKFSCPLSATLMKGCSCRKNKVPSSPKKKNLQRFGFLICQRSVKNRFLDETCSCNLYRLHRWGYRC